MEAELVQGAGRATGNTVARKETFVEQTRERLMTANQRLFVVLDRHDSLRQLIQGNSEDEVPQPIDDKPMGVRAITHEIEILFNFIERLVGYIAGLEEIV